MPELPEVETIKRGLSKAILNKKIADFKVIEKGSLKSNLENFHNALIGNKITKISRAGKLLIFKLALRDKFLLIHLKMTGQLIYRKSYRTKEKRLRGKYNNGLTNSLPNKFSRAFFLFADHSILYFNDMRRFGYLKISSEEEKNKIIKEKYGIDPISKNFTFANFRKILANKNIKIKTLLLDQKIIAGIGNIYADEICFEAGIKPDRMVKSLSKEEIKKIYYSIKKILERAIEHEGTTFGKFADGHYIDSAGQAGKFAKHLKVYRQEGQKCLKCKNEIISKKIISGRNTRYCPRCQK